MLKETMITMPLQQAIELKKGRRIKIKRCLTKFTKKTIKIQNGIYLELNITDKLLTKNILNKDIIVQITNKQIHKCYDITYIMLTAIIVDDRN